MSKTITLRIEEDVYKKFYLAAKADHRTISNLIQLLALKKLQEQEFVDDDEMNEIKNNKKLTASIQAGLKDLKNNKGKFLE